MARRGAVKIVKASRLPRVRQSLLFWTFLFLAGAAVSKIVQRRRFASEPEEILADLSLHDIRSNGELESKASTINRDERNSNDLRRFYDISSVPPKVVDWIRKWVRTDSCLNDPHALVASCCRKQCGGFSHRVNGLATLVLTAEKANRPLCISRMYFMPGPRDACKHGQYVHIRGTTVEFYKKPWNKRGNPDKVEPIRSTADPFAYNFVGQARYISTDRITDLKTLGLTGKSEVSKFGAAVLAFSGVVQRDWQMSQKLIKKSLGASMAYTPHVSLHVRCRGSKYLPSTPEDGRLVNNIPDRILEAMRSIPSDTSCRKSLFVASDSMKFKEVLVSILPKEMNVLSCCSKPVRLTEGGTHREVLSKELKRYQHIIDMEGLGQSEEIFKTTGAYAGLSQYIKQWHTIPQRSWPGTGERENENGSSREDQIDFLKDLLRAMECTSSIFE